MTLPTTLALLQHRLTPPTSKTVSVVASGTPGIAYGAGFEQIPIAKQTQQLDEMRLLGVRWLRLDVPWSDVQALDSNSWNWTAFDTTIPLISTRGINPLLILDFTPRWARSPDCSDDYRCAPETPPNTRVARRPWRLGTPLMAPMPTRFGTSRTRGTSGCLRPTRPGTPICSSGLSISLPLPHTATHPRKPTVLVRDLSTREVAVRWIAHLLKATYPAIHGADKDAIVITGGTAPAMSTDGDFSPTDYVDGMYRSGAGGYFDALRTSPLLLRERRRLLSTIFGLERLVANGRDAPKFCAA